ncbi:MAG: Rpn family recombination-promoting nuclease/putative transposase [Clostridia bacterium]
MSQKENNEVLLPTNDLIFKTIYGKEGSESITEDFIKAFLDLEVKIEKLEDSEPLDIDLTSEKLGILDVLATTSDGTRINLEMQVGNYANIEEKFSFYGMEIFVENVQKGKKYKDIDKTISVMILKDDYIKYREYAKHVLRWKLREEEYHDLILTDKLELCIISLEKIKKKIATGEIADNEKIAIWTKFLLTPNEIKEEEMSENEEVKKANEKYNEMLEDEKARRWAFKRHLIMMERNSLKSDGIEEGEEKAKKEIAKKLLNEKIDIEIIIKTTGLTKEEIEKLK